jgi:integrase
MATAHLRVVSAHHEEHEMPKQPKNEKTKVPGVYRRGNRYVYCYRVAGRQRWGSAPSLDEARRLKRQAEADADRGELVDVTNASFGEYAREWIEHYHGRTSRGFRESTRTSYRMQLNTRLIPYFDSVRRLRLAEIQPRDVKACVRWLVEQRDPRTGRLLSKSTIRQAVGVLRALLGDAVEEGLIRSNPARGIRVVVPEGDGTGRAPAAEKRAMTIPELHLVLGALPPEWRLMFELLAHSGLRIGEAIELRWGRDLILEERPRIKLRWQFADGRVCEPKTRYGKRDIPLSPGLTRKLLLAKPPNSDGQLVFASSFGTRLNRHNLYRDVLGPAVRSVGLPWVTLHTFRHTCASLLFAPPEHGGGGKNAKQIQEWLGHHSPAYTLREYVHLIDAGVGDATFLDHVTAA